MHPLGEPRSRLCELLESAFPNRDRFPDDCSISAAITENQPDLTEEINILERNGVLEDLVARLTRQHPTGVGHKSEHDDNFWRAWTEAVAFAWATEIEKLRRVTFSSDESGLPDLEVVDGPWIEAKTIDNSPEELAILKRQAAAGFGMRVFPTMSELSSNVLKKLEDQLQDSLIKSKRSTNLELIVFYSLRIDAGTSVGRALNDIIVWARTAARRTNARIVIVKRFNWKSPLIDTATV